MRLRKSNGVECVWLCEYAIVTLLFDLNFRHMFTTFAVVVSVEGKKTQFISASLALSPIHIALIYNWLCVCVRPEVDEPNNIESEFPVNKFNDNDRLCIVFLCEWILFQFGIHF